MNHEINEKVSTTLNALIEICKDGQKGFETAAENAKNAELQILCKQYAQQRNNFAQQLQQEVTQLGDNAADSGSLAGAAHRGWINMKSLATGDDDDAIIAECERGEDAAKEAYEKALSEYLPPSIYGVIQHQYNGVKEAHDYFSRLQKATR